MERQTYLQQLAAKIETLDNKIEQLITKAEQLDEKAKAECHTRMDQLKAKKQNFLNRLEEMGEASDEAFDDLKAGASAAWEDVDNAWADIKQAVESAIQRFSGAGQEADKK